MHEKESTRSPRAQALAVKPPGRAPGSRVYRRAVRTVDLAAHDYFAALRAGRASYGPSANPDAQRARERLTRAKAHVNALAKNAQARPCTASRARPATTRAPRRPRARPQRLSAVASGGRTEDGPEPPARRRVALTGGAL